MTRLTIAGVLAVLMTPVRAGTLTANCEINPATPTAVGQIATLSVKSASGPAPLSYSWNFGDGTAPTAFSTATSASHAYAGAGHFAVILTVRDGTGATGASTTTQTIHPPLTNPKPTASGTLAFSAASNRVWVVNPDADTVAAIDAGTLARVAETPVGKHPRTLALAPDGTVWVVNQDDASISVLNAGGTVVQTIGLPRASQPYGIVFSPDGTAAYVTLQGTGRVAKLNPSTRALTAQVDVGPEPRGLAVTSNSSRILVTRFLSPADRGEVVEISAGALTVARTIPLAMDPGPDTERGSRGVPNYLSSITISPDGRRAWVPSKKDNTVRGPTRDGLPLTFESSVRTIVSQIDLASNSESTRVDFNDHDMAFAVQFSRHGDLAFVLLQGTNTIVVLDAYAEERTIATIRDVGLAPQGLAFDASGTKLFTQNFMGRSVDVYDVSGVVQFTTNTVFKLATVATVASEKLTPQELLGKRIFYNAADRRMNRDGYISCASCHLDGGGDGRVWDFTDRGEGLRNTTDLRGRRGTGHGPVHWSANFDEIQDFEHDMRGPFGGGGFMADAAFHSGTRNTTLGDAKAGVSPELDALAAYVGSLKEVPQSPFRNADGSLTASARAGRAIFNRLDCASCHVGGDFTDSARRVLHDVGTIRPTSGKRLGQTLTGLDTPTLKGVWQTAPYLHDGSAATLDAVLTASHGGAGSLTATERRQLVAYLLQIDETESRIYRQGEPGTVSIEARHFSSRCDQGGHAWTLLADGALECTPNTGAQVDTGYAGVSPRLDYTVRFVKAGTHYVWIHGRGPTTSDNSVHAGLDWEESPASDRIGNFSPADTWRSATMDGPAATIEVAYPGVHTLSVWMREDGFVFDKLVITSDAAASFSGPGPEESLLDEVIPAAPAGGSAGGGGSTPLTASCGALGLEFLLILTLLKRRRGRS